MAQELAPRLLLTQILRTILIVFSISSLINAHSYIGPFWSFLNVTASFSVSWIIVAWNIICVFFAAIHPYLQRFADGLPFPITIKVRSKTILSYGDSDEDGDGLMAPLAGKLVFAFLDVALATLLVVFSSLARDLTIECRDLRCLGRDLHVQPWILNAWLTISIVEYMLVLVQGSEALGIWYNRRYLKKRGQISLA